MIRYDYWKLMSPYDDIKESNEKCKHCEFTFYIGQEVLYEGVTGECYCDYNCYQSYVKDNLEEFMNDIMMVSKVSSKIIEGR